MEKFIEILNSIVENFALVVIAILEIMGIFVIIVGAFKSIFTYCRCSIKKKRFNIKIDIGNTLALGLEFKMGAEIIKTVVVRTLEELWILGAIILLRAVLAMLIHWEIGNEIKHRAEVEYI